MRYAGITLAVILTCSAPAAAVELIAGAAQDQGDADLLARDRRDGSVQSFSDGVRTIP